MAARKTANARIPVIERMRRRSTREDRGYTTPCLIFRGALNSSGYGSVFVGRRDGIAHIRSPHQIAWEDANGDLAPGLTVDHLCRQRDCWEITHLEAVTNAENVLRGESFSAVNARKTHCPRNHPYDATNTYVDRSGRRHCIACRRDRDALRTEARLRADPVINEERTACP